MTDMGGRASMLPYTPAGMTGSDDDDDDDVRTVVDVLVLFASEKA